MIDEMIKHAMALALAFSTIVPARPLCVEDAAEKILAGLSFLESRRLSVTASTSFTDYPKFTQEELMEMSTLVVRGRLVGKSDAFIVDGLGIVTDYDFQVYEAYKGEPAGTLAIRADGGTVSRFNHRGELPPYLTLGDEYIFFLSELEQGGYQPIALHQGIFVLDGEGGYKNIGYEAEPLDFSILEPEPEK